jgi:hypothetical protein
MSADLHPDRGVPSDCRAAAEQIDPISTDLANTRSTTGTNASDVVTSGRWSGQAAEAYLTSLDAVNLSAQSAVDAWTAIAQVLRDYAGELEALQERGDAQRTLISGAQSDREYANRCYERYKQNVDDAYRAMSAQEDITAADDTIAQATVVLSQIAEERAELDNDTAEKLLNAPGPGAAAWQGLAYADNGARLPTSTIIDDLLDLLASDAYANSEVLAQFLSMYGSDPDVMSDFYSRLGAAGLADLLARTVDQMPPCPERESLKEALSAGLAVAASQWSFEKQQQYGTDLVRAIEDADESIGRQHMGLLVSDLLDAPGMPGHIALGILDRIEHLRENDPETFAEITQEGPIPPAVLGFDHSLMNTTFTMLATVAPEALAFFTEHSGSTDYWYGQHPWTLDQFEGPAVLLNAISNDPTVQAASTTNPPGNAWVDSVTFFSDAMQSLGGRLDYTTGNVSDNAKLNITLAAAAYIPEIAMLGEDTTGGGENALIADAFRNGALYEGPALDLSPGNLLRALGVALTDPAGLASFMLAANAYADDVLHYTTGDGHPGYEQVVDLIDSVGNLYGLTYASYAVEQAHDAQTTSDDRQRTLDTIFTIGSLLPGVSTGEKVGDYLVQVASVAAPEAASALTPGILTDDQISAIKHGGERTGRDALDTTFNQPFIERLGDLTEPYTVPEIDGTTRSAVTGDFCDNLTGAYDSAISEYGNADTTGTTQITLNNGETRTRDQMP